MKINFNDILFAFSYALDCVEHELLGATTNHGKRVAYISTVIGKSLGFDDNMLMDLAACSVLHDNALTEYLKTEYNPELLANSNKNELGIHCQIGEKNIKGLPFYGDVTGVILYHHENYDGTGPFGKAAKNTPLMAQLIHFADILDVSCNLGVYTEGKEEKIYSFLKKKEGTLFSPQHVELFLRDFDTDNFKSMYGDNIDSLLKSELPICVEECPKEKLFNIASFFATIIDYKSEVTSSHSRGIAEKALVMANYYGYDDETAQKLYLAGAVHDVGKLVVSNDVLEKPGKLNESEYKYIQTHAYYSYEILNKISGFEDITKWAALHHERLDGSGYPFGMVAAELGKNERMMACLDVYQALTEARSYKNSMPHSVAIAILRKMVRHGEMDAQIVEDIDKLFGDEIDETDIAIENK